MYMSASYSSTSRCTCGRGPTTLMVPFRELKNCGSSSMLYFLMNLPTRVTRGSSFILNSRDCPPVSLISAWIFSSASMHMLRNFHTL